MYLELRVVASAHPSAPQGRAINTVLLRERDLLSCKSRGAPPDFVVINVKEHYAETIGNCALFGWNLEAKHTQNDRPVALDQPSESLQPHVLQIQDTVVSLDKVVCCFSHGDRVLLRCTKRGSTPALVQHEPRADRCKHRSRASRPRRPASSKRKMSRLASHTRCTLLCVPDLVALVFSVNPLVRF